MAVLPCHTVILVVHKFPNPLICNFFIKIYLTLYYLQQQDAECSINYITQVGLSLRLGNANQLGQARGAKKLRKEVHFSV